MLIEVTAKVARVSEDIYGTASDAIEWASRYTDKELDLFVRFQEQSLEWLERHLAHAEELNARKPVKRQLRGRGQA